MVKYTNTVRYFNDPTLFKNGIYSFDVVPTTRIQLDADNPIYARAQENFCQRKFMYPAPPVFMGKTNLDVPQEPIYALRLLIKQPQSAFFLPENLRFLEEYIRTCTAYQMRFFPAFEERFVYLTVRSGPVLSKQEDALHVDGFQGASVPRHIPEQNYLWVNKHPTLFSLQPYFVENLDPAKHNIAQYFEKATDKSCLYQGVEQGVYLIDPYHVHARQKLDESIVRCVVRLTFSPVEIRDDTSTVNPALPRGPYNREDVRNFLWDYEEIKPELKFGLTQHKEQTVTL